MVKYAFTAFGPDPESWGVNGDAPRASAPGIRLFGAALQVWSVLQGRRVTVAEAAAAFRCPEALIREAVDEHYWMFLVGDAIDHEGE